MANQTLVCDFIRSCLHNPFRISSINETFLTLLPKDDNPDSMRKFQPISLCSVIYKALTKVIVNKLKGLMSYLIAPMQCSFVPRRHGTNNVIIVQEVVHSMKTKKEKKESMAIKVDLEKAYYLVNWSFLKIP